MSNQPRADIDDLCGMFKALSNPQRLRMFLKLAECSTPAACDATDEGMRRCVGDLSEDLEVTASTVSHHLKELRQAGLMQVQRRGQKVECWVRGEALQVLVEFFDHVVERRGRSTRARRAASTGRRR